MKKKIIIGAVAVLGLFGIGQAAHQQSKVAGIETTKPSLTPTVLLTATPTYTPTPTIIPSPTIVPTNTPTPTTVYKTPTYQQSQSVNTSTGLSNDNYYTNSDGNEVHSPAYSNSVPAGATAQCGDGTYSFSQHRSGTCSHHGGVATWY